MNKLTTIERAAILNALVEGNSIASCVRLFKVSKVTILRLLADAGTIAKKHHDETVVELSTRRIQMDEIWSFVGAKEKNATHEKKMGLKWGDAWTWTAIDADSKLMIAWIVGPRHAGTANIIARDVASRLPGRVQVTTDGLKAYVSAIGNAFDVDTRSDYAQCVKKYADMHTPGTGGKYSPGECIGVEITVKWGDPDEKHISTSFVERANLTIRMGNRRFTRLTNGFSKKVENHEHSLALQMWNYNFCRQHLTLETTPAVMAGVANHEWTMVEFVEMMEREETAKGGRITDYKMAASKRRED